MISASFNSFFGIHIDLYFSLGLSAPPGGGHSLSDKPTQAIANQFRAHDQQQNKHDRIVMGSLAAAPCRPASVHPAVKCDFTANGPNNPLVEVSSGYSCLRLPSSFLRFIQLIELVRL
jgi:hypothetical protein